MVRRIVIAAVALYLGLLCYFWYSLELADNTTRSAASISHVAPKFAGPKLCVIVPFRDRYDELKVFAPYMHSFLNNQSIPHEILVLNQTDRFRFNRASLINVGWLEASSLNCSYMVMHDVDLLPATSEINYRFPGEGVVRHITSPEYHPKYHYTKFIGGILMLTMKDFEKIDGMSNKYWGWGMEDDELYLRLSERKDLVLTRTKGLSTNSTNSFRHIHPKSRKRDYEVASPNQRAMKRQRDRLSGLHNVYHAIRSRALVQFEGADVHLIAVALKCNMKWTPYCLSAAQKG
ncbi:unnamed protein product, partial [Mesorhabditis spiculigera]